jgi:hypothetical protein
LYETNNQCAFSEEARVKVHGNTSQMWPLKALDLEAAGAFRYRIFPDRERSKFNHFLLRPSGQDQQAAFMRDDLTESLAAETGLETQASRACVVFINGEYWGLSYLKEKQNVQFVTSLSGRSKKQIDYVKEEGAKAGAANDYYDLLEYLRRHDLKSPENYRHVAEAIDVANFIDYVSCEIFFYRWDINQHRLWRPRTPDGRWRWLDFDNDVAWGGFWAHPPAWQFNMLAAELATDGSLNGHNTEETTLLLRRLVSNPEFQREFVNRFQDLLNTTFLPSHTRTRIDKLSSVLAPEMEEHIRRWRAPGSLAEWQGNVDALRTYAAKRPYYAREQLRKRFALRPACTLTVWVSPGDGGTVRLNTIPIHAGPTNVWTGLYFAGHPITSEAQPSPGFRFAGWDGVTDSQSSPITFSIDEDAVLTARFVRDHE